MSAYPADFADWPPDQRNALFAAEAAAYEDRRRASQSAPPPPKSEDDYGFADATALPNEKRGDDLGEQPGKTKAPAAVQFKPTPFAYREPSKILRRQFAYGRHFIRGFVSVTTAPAGVGKSALELVDAIAMASWRDLLGVKAPQQLRVWYVNLEDPREEIERRAAAICLHFGIKRNEIEGHLALDGREIEIIIAEQAKNEVKIAVPVEEALVTALKSGGFDILILDPFISTHRAAENDNAAIDAIAKTFGRIAGNANCAVELVHHVRKTGGAEITAEDGRGASALVAAARSVRVLNPMSEKEAGNSGVGELRRSYFRSDIGKANLAPPSTKATWHRLVSVPLGNGSGGPADDQDYVGVATPWQWPNAFDGVTVSDLRRVQARVNEGRWRENCQAKDWVGNAVAQTLGLDVNQKADKVRIVAMLKTWIRNGALVIVEGFDDKRNLRPYVEIGTLADD